MYLRIHSLFRMFCVVGVSLLLAFVVGIGCASDPLPKTCTSNSECEKNERCLQSKCKEISIVNEKPIGRASGPSTGRINSAIKLDGTLSSDAEGSVLTFRWSIKSAPSGSKAELQDAAKDIATLVPDIGGAYVIQLIVVDDKDQESIPVNVNISVQDKDQNGRPIADAGLDQFGGVGSKLTLDGSRSTDPDGDTLTFQWSISSKPSDSNATLSAATESKPTVTFDKLGKYIFELVVNDGIEASAADSVTIEIIEDFDLEPVADKLSPDSGASGTSAEVTITGTGFSPRAIVLFDGSSLSSDTVTIKSKTEIVFQLKLAGLSAKAYPVVVRNLNGKESKPLSFNVLDLPAPTLASMSPTSSVEGAKLTLTLIGTNFVASSKILFNLSPLVTTFKNETTLEAELDLSQTGVGDYEVKVENPGGKSSPTLTFKVVSGGGFAPVLQVLNPSQATVGTDIPFSVHGSSFDPGAVIIFDGKEIPSIRQARDTIESDPTLDLTKVAVGTYQVWVRNPNGKESNKETFEVIEKDPAPKLDRILPPSLYLNDTAQIDVYGNFFDPKVKLFIGTNEYSGTDLQNLSRTYFTVTVDTSQGTWSLGNIAAYVENPNGKKSGTFSIAITNKPTVPPPVISRVSPTSGESGKTISSFYIYGKDFCSSGGSTCSPLPTVFIIDGNGVDWQAKSTIYTSITSNLGSSSPHIRGKLDLTGVPAGSYQIQLEHGTTKAKSNTVNFTVKPGPGIRIDSLDPPSGDVGVNIADFRIYGDYFCPGTTKCTTLPKIYIKDTNGVDLQATQSVYTVTTSSLGSSSSYIRGALDVIKMPKGNYTFQLEHPTDGKKSNILSFVVSTPKPLSLDYIFPYYATSGSIVKCDLNGGPFTSSTYVLIGTDKIPLLSGTSTTRRSFNFDVMTKYAQSGNYDIQVCNSPTVCSTVFAYPVMSSTGTAPFITAVKGPSYPMITNTTFDLSLFGYRWIDAPTAKFYIDGKELNTTNFTYATRTCKQATSATSSSNCVFKQFSTKTLTAGKHTMYVEWGATKSITYDFYIQAP